MSSQKYSDIYEGNWSYSLYGGEQGILFIERKTQPFSSNGEALDLTSEGNNSMSLEQTKTIWNAAKVFGDARLSVRAYPRGSEARPRTVVDEKNRQHEMEGISPGTPRPGTGQTLMRRVQLESNVSGLTPKNKNTQGLEQVDNVKTTENLSMKQGGQNNYKNEANEWNADDDVFDAQSSKSYGRTEEEIEGLKKRLRRKSEQKKNREAEHTQQRELLWKWVVEKSMSQGQDISQSKCRSKSTNDIARSGRVTDLEDIAEDERMHSDEGRTDCLSICLSVCLSL